MDGINSNDGIFMAGSTIHLERLDPGISVRITRVEGMEMKNPRDGWIRISVRDRDDDGLDDLIWWVEMTKQVKTLRKALGDS